MTYQENKLNLPEEIPDGIHTVLRRMRLRSDILIDENGILDPRQLGDELATRVFEAGVKLDRGDRITRTEVRALREAIPPGTPREDWASRIDLTASRQPNTREEFGSSLQKRLGSTWRGPGRYSNG